MAKKQKHALKTDRQPSSFLQSLSCPPATKKWIQSKRGFFGKPEPISLQDLQEGTGNGSGTPRLPDFKRYASLPQ
jgi:hypothetical protein